MNQSYKLIACAILGAGYITVTGMAAVAQDEFADPVSPENIIPQETRLQLRQKVANLVTEQKELNARIKNIKDNQGEIEKNAKQLNEIADAYTKQADAVAEAYVICDALVAGLVKQKKLAELTDRGILRKEGLVNECYERADKQQDELRFSMNHRRMLIQEGNFLKEDSGLNVDEATYLKGLLKAVQANLESARIRLRHLGGE